MDPESFFVAITYEGQANVFRNQEVIHHRQQLPMQYVNYNCVKFGYLDGHPVVVVGGSSACSGFYMYHAISLEVLKFRKYEARIISCVYWSSNDTVVYFGTEDGL